MIENFFNNVNQLIGPWTSNQPESTYEQLSQDTIKFIGDWYNFLIEESN